MNLLKEIQNKIKLRQYEYSKHALDQSIARGISVSELEQALTYQVEIIEDYPEDKYGASCLILGFTVKLRPIHIQCSYPSRPLLKIITLYEPHPALWINFRIRKKN
jgi:hypothetical protein